MIINDFDVPSVAVAPAKADTPLIVDAYAVLCGTIENGIMTIDKRKDPSS
jgi:hypothetical protein